MSVRPGEDAAAADGKRRDDPLDAMRRFKGDTTGVCRATASCQSQENKPPPTIGLKDSLN